MLLRRMSFVAAVIAAVGCANVDKPTRLTVQMPQQWENAQLNEASTNDSIWWQTISDEQLKKLITTGLDSNYTVERARLTLQRSILQGKMDIQLQAPLAQSSLSMRSTGSRLDARTTNAGAGLSLAYAPDLWGNQQRTRQLDEINTQLANANLSQIKWWLSTEIAGQYWIQNSAVSKTRLLQENLAAAAADLRAFESRYAAGKARASERESMVYAEENIQLQIHSIGVQLENARQQLKILLGSSESRSSLSASDLSLPRSPTLRISAPALVLDRRPDVMAARLQLDAALVQEKIAQRSGYPDLQLSAGLSTGAAIVKRIFANPISFIAGSLSLPYFSPERSRLTSELAKIDAMVAFLRFKETIFSAIAETEIYFSEAKQIDAEFGGLQLRKNAAQKVLQDATVRHAVGYETLENVRRAERDLRETQISELDLELRDWLNYLDTLRALGGPV